MPIVRSYMCQECAHQITITLSSDQWDDPPPDCPRCIAWDFQHTMQQDFKPVAINGSNAAKARALAEDIAANDYHVADMQHEHRYEGKPKVRYKDETPASLPAGTWAGVSQDTLAQAIAIGRETRLNFGSGLDILQHNIKTGAEPDLIANSKKMSGRVW